MGLTNATSSAKLGGTATAYSVSTPVITGSVTSSEGGIWTAVIGSGAAGLGVTNQKVENVDLSKYKL